MNSISITSQVTKNIEFKRTETNNDGRNTIQLFAELPDNNVTDISITRSVGDSDEGRLSTIFTTYTIFFINGREEMKLTSEVISSLVHIAFPDFDIEPPNYCITIHEKINVAYLTEFK